MVLKNKFKLFSLNSLTLHSILSSSFIVNVPAYNIFGTNSQIISLEKSVIWIYHNGMAFLARINELTEKKYYENCKHYRRSADAVSNVF